MKTLVRYHRKSRKKDLISSTSRSGSSSAAKWPPEGMGVQRFTLKTRSTHSLGGRRISPGKDAIPVGRVIFSPRPKRHGL